MFDKRLMRTKPFIRTSEAQGRGGDTELRKKREQSAARSRQRRSLEKTKHLQGIQKSAEEKREWDKRQRYYFSKPIDFL